MYTKIKYLRWLAALTQDELAEKAELGRSTIQAAESGKLPRITSLRGIARALNCTVQELYTEDKKYADGIFDPSKPDGPVRSVA